MTKTSGNTPYEGPVSEATLMRFIDGDLPPREHAFVAGLIASHPEETRSVRAYRFTKEVMPGAFAEALYVSPELIRRCLPASRVPWREAAWSAIKAMIPEWRLATMAAAASIAMVIAGSAGWRIHEALHPAVASLMGVAPASLQHALDEALSDSFAQLGGNVRLEPTMTFSAGDSSSGTKRWCRQYSLQYATGDDRTQATGVACRTRDGSWRIELQSAFKLVQQKDPRQTFAAGPDAEDPVTGYRDQIISGERLSNESEKVLIRNEGWKRAP